MSPRVAASGAAQAALPIVSLPPPPGRDGGPVLSERNNVEYVEMTVRSILNWVDGTHMSDVFSINPYRGCEFGCAYCYARYTHEFMDLPDWEAFERRIFVKTAAARALRRDLASSRDVRSYGIAIGTATDPYQPAEAHFRITRQILEALLPHRDIPISIVTKSALVERDADLLAALAERHPVKVHFSCITTDRHLLRAIERRSPMAHLRFKAMRTLTDRGLHCDVLVMPVLPGITDSEDNLVAVMSGARAAGARSASARALWLSEASRKRFLPWLAEQFPKLYARYQSAYGERGMYTPESYRAALEARVDRARKRAGFGGRTEVVVSSPDS
jgi:DNA repair photolyase